MCLKLKNVFEQKKKKKKFTKCKNHEHKTET